MPGHAWNGQCNAMGSESTGALVLGSKWHPGDCWWLAFNLISNFNWNYVEWAYEICARQMSNAFRKLIKNYKILSQMLPVCPMWSLCAIVCVFVCVCSVNVAEIIYIYTCSGALSSTVQLSTNDAASWVWHLAACRDHQPSGNSCCICWFHWRCLSVAVFLRSGYTVAAINENL